MTEQCEALRLADLLDAHQFDEPHAAAAELRRLVAENESLRQIVEDFPPIEAELREVSDSAHRMEAQRDLLLEALKKLDDFFETYRPDGHPVSDPHELARAALKAVEE